MDRHVISGRLAGFSGRAVCLWRQARVGLVATALLATCAARAATPALASGVDFSLAVDDAGRLWGWGKQVAVGAKVPQRVAGLPPVASIHAGDKVSFAIDRTGVLWAWGNNKQAGLGDGSTVTRALPVQIGSGYRQVSANVNHTLGLKTDGSLWAWGNGGSNVFGNGSVTFEQSPIHVGDGYSSVVAGYAHGLALKPDGSVWAWGRNQVGQLGVGSADSPVPVAVGINARTIAAGYDHSVILQANGDVWAWGSNTWGQVGEGTFRTTTRPKLIATGFASISAYGNTTVGVKTDGTLWLWGAVAASNESAYAYTSPTLAGSGYSSAVAGFEHVLVLKRGGALSALGNNVFGQLGDGTATFREDPVAVPSSYKAMAAGSYHSLALWSDGSVWAWGDDSEGQLGNGPTAAKSTPAPIGSGFQSVAVGYNHRLALKSDGALLAWGFRGPGMGLGPGGPRDQPEQVGLSYSAVTAGEAHTLAIKRDGTLWVWGSNFKNQLGFPSNGEWKPVQLGSTRDKYSAVAAGWSHSLAIRTDGSLWGWGDNDSGQLGLGDQVGRATPTKIGDGYRSVSAGAFHTMALKADGSLWAWGGNGWGQLGIGSWVRQLSPVLVGTGYSKVVSGAYHVLGLKTDGSLWAWGGNDDYQLGNGTATSINTPMQIGKDFADIGAGPTVEHSVALRRDGTVWVWGSNTSGQLGDGTFASAPRPINLVNETATGPLVLTASGGGSGTADRLLYLMKLLKQGYDLKAVISDLRAGGVFGDVFFTALLPKNIPGVTCTVECRKDGSSADPGTGVDPSRRRALKAHLGALADSAGSGVGMVAGVLSRGGFKQTGGTAYGPATQTYTGDLGRSGTLDIVGGVGDVLTGTNAVICMGVGTTDMTAKGQVLMRPIATGSAVQGVVQCPPVQTGATNAQFLAEASGPITSRSITAVINPNAEDRGRSLKIFAWAVAPDGKQYMQTGPGQWAEMTEPMLPAAEVTLPASGSYRLEVTRNLDLSGLVGTLVFIGIGDSWEAVRNFNRAGQSYVVQ